MKAMTVPGAPSGCRCGWNVSARSRNVDVAHGAIGGPGGRAAARADMLRVLRAPYLAMLGCAAAARAAIAAADRASCRRQASDARQTATGVRLDGTKSCQAAPSCNSASRASTWLRSTPTPSGICGPRALHRVEQHAANPHHGLVRRDQMLLGPVVQRTLRKSDRRVLDSTPRSPVQLSSMRSRLWPNELLQFPRKLPVLRS